MYVIRKINNNCVLARDSAGADVVAFGKGIGFPAIPYELDDLRCVERTFYGMDASSIRALRDIPSDVMAVSSDIMESAQAILKVELNPNAAVTLADHVAFAIKRTVEGIVIESPLAFDVKRFYPREYRLGTRAVRTIKKRLGVALPEAERTNIALHLINSESVHPDMAKTKRAAEAISEITVIVERELGVVIDKESFAYNRFVTHARYLIDRILSGEETGVADEPMLREMKASYPVEARCVEAIIGRLKERWQWTCSASEELYLLLHVHQLRGRLE